MRHKTAPAVLTAMSWVIIAGCSASPITISESDIRAVFTPGTSVRMLWDTTSQPVNVGAKVTCPPESDPGIMVGPPWRIDAEESLYSGADRRDPA
jgi:hypothetical protein